MIVYLTSFDLDGLDWDELDEERPGGNSLSYDLLSSVNLTRFAGLSGALRVEGFAIVGEFSKEDQNECVSDKFIRIVLSWDG